jgi:hypothetical protein
MRISVGPDPITITDLGRFCLSGNQGKHMLKLVRAMTVATLPVVQLPCPMFGGRIGEFNMLHCQIP